ncbi:MAG TPA: hypothetical protein VGB73_02065 [Pyrinomonadaceae bacterium]|jgi:hypothetical protein
MPKKWFLGNGQNSFVIARRVDLFPPEVNSLPAQTFSDNFEQWSAIDETHRTIRDLWETVVQRSAKHKEDQSLAAMESDLMELFNGGELVILRTQPRDILPRMKETAGAAQSAQQERAREKKTTWIEIELLNEKNQPVPNERYRIEMPDGSTEDGFLDDLGRARFDGIDQGTCKVSFPDIDAREWKQA